MYLNGKVVGSFEGEGVEKGSQRPKCLKKVLYETKLDFPER